jgi:hypothetical protein
VEGRNVPDLLGAAGAHAVGTGEVAGAVGTGYLEPDLRGVESGGQAKIVEQDPDDQHLVVEVDAASSDDQHRELDAAMAVVDQELRRGVL